MLQVSSPAHTYRKVNFHMVLIKQTFSCIGWTDVWFCGSQSHDNSDLKGQDPNQSHLVRTALITLPANQGPFQQIFSGTFQLQATITRLFLPSCFHTRGSLRPSHTHSSISDSSQKIRSQTRASGLSHDGSPSFSRMRHHRRVSCHQQYLIKPKWVELAMSATMQLAII